MRRLVLLGRRAIYTRWTIDHSLDANVPCWGRVAQQFEETGYRPIIGMELEFTLFEGTRQHPHPVHLGPAYGTLPLLQLGDWSLSLLDAFETAGVRVEQLHPEFGEGQMEVSFAPDEPVAAVDEYVLARLIVTRVALAHGLRASFAPVAWPDTAANGMHIHLSAQSEDHNAFQAAEAELHGIGPTGAMMLAGVLDKLDESIALLGGTILSFRRLQPRNWAGAYICWGEGNREAASRLIRGQNDDARAQANIEIKCGDGSANPYLAVAAVVSSAFQGVHDRLTPPEEIRIEPSTLTKGERKRLRVFPADLGGALDPLEKSAFYRKTLGELLLELYVSVHRHEWVTYQNEQFDKLSEAARWRH